MKTKTDKPGKTMKKIPTRRVVLKIVEITVLIFFGFLYLNPALARPGDLDSSFGVGGKVVTDVFVNSAANGITLQNDGKIIAAGFTFADSVTKTDFAIVRYNTNGSLDTGFGAGGIVRTDFKNDTDIAFAVAVQSNGKIIAAGTAFYASSPASADDFALARYNVDGSLDSSFGTGGKVHTDFPFNPPYAGLDDKIQTIVIQPDDSILAAGYAKESTDETSGDFALVLYNSNGSLNTGFGTGGKVTTDFAGGRDEARAVVRQASGNFIVAGMASQETNRDFALASYKPDGSLNTGFGTNGKVTTDFYGNRDEARAMAILADGKIVVAGMSSKSGAAPSDTDGIDESFALAKYNPDGSLDTSFGEGGKITLNLSVGFNDQASALAVQNDGKLLVVGTGWHDNLEMGLEFAMMRSNLDGSLDKGFGACGEVLTDFVTENDYDNDWANAVVLQPDGKIVALGDTTAVGPGSYLVTRFALARYLSGPSEDSSHCDQVAEESTGGEGTNTEEGTSTGGKENSHQGSSTEGEDTIEDTINERKPTSGDSSSGDSPSGGCQLNQKHLNVTDPLP